MYFQSRAEAGYRLALELMQYRYEDTVVLCLSDGAVLVGQQIAASLHAALTMMLVEEIDVPGEGTLFGTVNQSGRFTYNGMFSIGEIEEYFSEFHGYLEDQKRAVTSRINRILSDGGIVDEAMLRGHNVIVVADGLPSGTSLDAVADYMKPIRIKKLVVVTPIASVDAVDRMHILGDELHVLGVTENYMGTNHYYDNNDIPDHEEVISILNNVIMTWR
ncbi:MAG: phosphoribosyltransferase family protein [Candidatus Saccharimonadales bacterium]